MSQVVQDAELGIIIGAGAFLLWTFRDSLGEFFDFSKDVDKDIGDFLKQDRAFLDAGKDAPVELLGILTGNEDKVAERKTVANVKELADQGNWIAKGTIDTGVVLAQTFGGVSSGNPQKEGTTPLNNYSDPLLIRRISWGEATQIDGRDQLGSELFAFSLQQAKRPNYKPNPKLVSFQEAFTNIQNYKKLVSSLQRQSFYGFAWRNVTPQEVIAHDTGDTGLTISDTEAVAGNQYGLDVMWKGRNGKIYTWDLQYPVSNLKDWDIGQFDDGSIWLRVIDDGKNGYKENYGKKVAMGIAGHLDETLKINWRKARTDDDAREAMIDALNALELPIGYLAPEATSIEASFLRYYRISWGTWQLAIAGVPQTPEQSAAGFRGFYLFMPNDNPNYYT